MSERIIRDGEYKVDTPLGEKALELQFKFLKSFGKSLSGFAQALPFLKSEDAEERKQATKDLANALFVSFTDGDVKELMEFVKFALTFVQLKRPSGSYHSVSLQSDIRNDLSLAVLLVVFVIQEVLGDFFAEFLQGDLLTEMGFEIPLED